MSIAATLRHSCKVIAKPVNKPIASHFVECSGAPSACAIPPQMPKTILSLVIFMESCSFVIRLSFKFDVFINGCENRFVGIVKCVGKIDICILLGNFLVVEGYYQIKIQIFNL